MGSHEIRHGSALHQAFLDDTQRCGSGNGINPEKSLRLNPMGHVRRERNEQEDTSYQSWVEYILSQTSESHLRNPDGHDGADQDHPPRSGRRQVEREQDTRNRSGPVPYGTWLAKQVSGNRPLDKYAREHAHGEHQKLFPAVEHDRNYHRRQQRDHNVAHKDRSGGLRVQVRIR